MDKTSTPRLWRGWAWVTAGILLVSLVLTAGLATPTPASEPTATATATAMARLAATTVPSRAAVPFPTPTCGPGVPLAAMAVLENPKVPDTTMDEARAIPADLEAFVALALVRKGSDGVVAQTLTCTLQCALVNPLGLTFLHIWSARSGDLVDEGMEAIRTAFACDHSEWPNSTCIFTLRANSQDSATVWVFVYYNMGIVPDSRGGYGERWDLQRGVDGWSIAVREPFAHWD